MELALDHLRRALAIYHRLHEKADEAATLLRMANAEQRLGDLEGARLNLEKALELQTSREDRGGEARVRNSLGTVYLLSKKMQPARESYQKALDLSRQTKNRYEEATALHNLARLAYEIGENRQASELHEQAARLFREIGNRPRQVSALFGSARALHRLGEDAEANLRLERVLASLEDLRTAADSIDLRTGFLATKQHYYDLHIDVLMRLHERQPGKGYDGRALYVNESRRARGLLDLLAEGGHALRRGVQPELLEREESLQQSINALDLRIMSLGEADSRESAAVESEQRQLLLEMEEVRTRIGRQNPRLLTLRKPETLTFPEIQQRVLGESSLLLIYALGEERSLLWLVPHRGNIEMHRLPSRSRIESLAQQAHRVLRTRGGRARDERWLSQLSAMLLEPVAERLGEKRLVIVADGALESLPFAALPDPRQKGPDAQPLIARHEIVYLPSASVLATVRRDLADRLPAPRRLAMLADPVFSPADPRLSGINASPEPFEDLQRSAQDLSIDGFERLPYTEEEAAAIRKLLPEDQRFEATGFQASRETVLSGQLRRYRILHFATHGVLNPKHPELSGLVLSLYDEKGHARDGFLRAYEISNLDLPAELAVLSACQTGLGQEVRGEGLLGLTRSFMYAGVPRVVVSLWNVSDQGTAVLMERFYRGLFEEKLRPPEALRCAQLSMLEDERFSDPYYWAPFVFQGEWRLEIRSSDGGIEQRVGGSGAGTRSDDDLPPPLQRASSSSKCPDLD
jgi:CHAT domain-containing protein/Tfp pilus assembly protein PilF